MQTYIETSAWMGTARGPINFWDRLFESWQDLFVDFLTHNNEILLLDLFNQRFFLKAKASPSLYFTVLLEGTNRCESEIP